MSIPKPIESFSQDILVFPACLGDKINFNGIITCANPSTDKQWLEGLCSDCQNRSFCVWKDEKKIFCEHYK